MLDATKPDYQALRAKLYKLEGALVAANAALKMGAPAVVTEHLQTMRDLLGDNDEPKS